LTLPLYIPAILDALTHEFAFVIEKPVASWTLNDFLWGLFAVMWASMEWVVLAGSFVLTWAFLTVAFSLYEVLSADRTGQNSRSGTS
jgi:hypothetical protein